MKTIKYIFQEALEFFLYFLISFVWIRYLCESLLKSVLFSILLSLALYAIVKFFSRKKKNREALKLKDKEYAEDIFLTLACDTKYIEFFFNLASKQHENVKKFSKYIEVAHDTGTKTILYPSLEFEKLTETKVVEIYNKVKNKAGRVVVVCFDYDKSVINFAKNFDTEFLFLDRYEAYSRLYKAYDCYPELKIRQKKEANATVKGLIEFSFNKKRVKGYLLSALLLILSSLFVKATLYYSIVASLLVVFAIISQFNSKFNKPQAEVI